ncbi:hypothetical protein B7P43_G12290 [Cryptotermes secundus]|uniref:CCHC-type domain-containing protein n=1 Tax=Cryptotermes secundus TaxID=105785 RepID=A0A2J7PU99_9NEOP|nr:hypothetical protein B7P43_G12290 [Cryptotermes secundus]
MPNLQQSSSNNATEISEADDQVVHVNHRRVSVDTAVKLLKSTFSGNPNELQEFTANVENAFSLLDPVDHAIFLKFLLAHIKGDAKTVISYRTIPEEFQTWETVKDKLELNYAVQRTLDFYANKLFTSRQIQGLCDDSIKTITRVKAEDKPLKQLIEIALEEESARKSREQFRAYNVNQGRTKYVKDVYRPQNVRSVGGTRTSSAQVNRKPGVNATAAVTCLSCQKPGHRPRDCKGKPFCELCSEHCRDCRGNQGNRP